MPIAVLIALTCAIPAIGLLWLLRRHMMRSLGPAMPDFNAIACASTNDGIVVQTLDGVIIWANPAYLGLFRLPADRVIGRNPLSFCLPPDETPTPAQIAAFRYDRDDPQWRKLFVQRNRRSDRTLFWNQLSVSFHQTGEGTWLVVLVCRDVTEQVEQDRNLRETTRSLAHIADHDSLTGTANRNKFNSFVMEVLSAAPPGQPGLGLLQIDLDMFKTINDRHGHAAGDAALQHVATTIQRNLRQTDLLARLGGDEFVAVCPGVTQDAELLRIGRALCDAVRAPLVHDGKEIAISISVGAALADAHDKNSDRLLQKSDFALYDVKRTGRGHAAIYDSNLHTLVQRRDRLSLQLRDAIEGDRLSFYFQPTIDLATGVVRGFEALARWQHPAKGLIHPSDFLPLARELNLLAAVDIAAARAAASLHKRLDYNGFGHVRVGMNGSHHLLDDTDHIAALPAEFGRVGVQTRHVVIELAEREVFGDAGRIDANVTAIARLVDSGFSVLIDGFGAGYAGLLHIERLAVAGFKVEKALIRHLDSAPACERITSMLLQFAREKQ
ncbi:putative bifunctional diguanylate cyclase/phosphodiesterase, partial [Loktanella sp. DJP18]|uniref:putative bifunctional diguanylate cyclase/phosphodiesterase n=1 Tax=Loktanella sp. DJP18 TaxID=3409788 RepID=UPI003BB7565C